MLGLPSFVSTTCKSILVGLPSFEYTTHTIMVGLRLAAMHVLIIDDIFIRQLYRCWCCGNSFAVANKPSGSWRPSNAMERGGVLQRSCFGVDGRPAIAPCSLLYHLRIVPPKLWAIHMVVGSRHACMHVHAHAVCMPWFLFFVFVLLAVLLIYAPKNAKVSKWYHT